MLNGTMKEMVGDFGKEINSVRYQFYIFLFSYVTQCVYVTVLSNQTLVSKLGEDNLDLSYMILAFFWQIVPTFTVLLLHYQAFDPRRL